jgi:thiosulfate reductase cytochrome b subunit
MRPPEHENSEVVLRHRLPVRVWHWISVLAVVGLLFTGFCILNVHPRLYWGEVGNAYTPAILALDSSEPRGPQPTTQPAPAVLVVGNRRFDVTGRLGVVQDAGDDGLYFLIANTPESWHFGAMRAWHFTIAWILVLGWMSYAIYLIASGQLRSRLLPRITQLRLRAIAHDVLNHLRFHRATGEEAKSYNLLQKLSYLLVVFVLLPLMILTGLTMSNAVTARFPELCSLFGGRESVRTIHFLCAFALVLFVVIHVIQLFVAGFSNEMRSMITGRFTIRGTKAP